MSWQGQPAVIRSTGGTAAQSRGGDVAEVGHPGVAGGQDGGGVPVGLGAPGQPGTQDSHHGEVEAAVAGAQAAGSQLPGTPGRRGACQACRVRGGHAAR